MAKQVVILGGFTHEGLNANAKALGYELLKLSLDGVKPNTWLKRAKLLEELANDENLAATIIYLHTTLLLQASKSEYKPAFLEILNQARKSKTIVFIFQDNLDGIFSMRHWQTRIPMTIKELEIQLKDSLKDKFEDDYPMSNTDRIKIAIERLKDYECRKLEVDSLINFIYESGAEVAPFFVRSDVTIRLQEFLGDIEQGVFLRLFVPNDRLQAEQLKSLLSVLERYLRQVEGQNFSIDSRKSDNGIIYIFRSGSGVSSLQSLNDALMRFDSFMRMCGDQPEQALQVLIKQGFSDYDSAFFVERYSRDYKRLILESKHEFERKSLLLKQRLETDILDQNGKQVISWENEGISSLISAVATGSNIAINIGKMSVINSQSVHAEIEKMINGSIVYNDNDRQLLELFTKYANDLEALQCRSDLDQLKDSSVAEPARQNAKQRLIGFLRKAAKKAGDVTEKVAVGVLSKYIESILKGGI